MFLDLGSLESVRTFAKEVLKDFPKVNVLINNAGVSIPVSERRRTKDRFEVNFGINHLGHFLLTNLLLPRLKESTPSRYLCHFIYSNADPLHLRLLGSTLLWVDAIIWAQEGRQWGVEKAPQ